MNNSKIASFTEEPDISPLEKQRGEWTQIVEAINRVEESDDWQKLKRLFLDGIVSTLENQLKSASSKDEIEPAEIYRLQGQLVWARKYADIKKLSDFFRKQIENINNQINAKNPADGAA